MAREGEGEDGLTFADGERRAALSTKKQQIFDPYLEKMAGARKEKILQPGATSASLLLLFLYAFLHKGFPVQPLVLRFIRL